MAHENVFGFYIAVGNPVFVSVGKRMTDLANDIN
jgi:hypothetical protein